MVVDLTDPVTFEDYSALQRKEYEAGNQTALLPMILICVQDQKPLPDWAGTAFENAYHLVVTGGARSWDDVFGKPYPKGKHVHSSSGKLSRAFAIHALVRDIHKKEGVPIDVGLFDRVGRGTGFGGSTVIGKLYYKAEHILRRLRNEGHLHEI
jgi:hypothetical protein